jgi:hypothetical protein
MAYTEIPLPFTALTFEGSVLTARTASLTLRNTTFSPQCVCMDLITQRLFQCTALTGWSL